MKRNFLLVMLVAAGRRRMETTSGDARRTAGCNSGGRDRFAFAGFFFEGSARERTFLVRLQR